jgi:hypothetical protein
MNSANPANPSGLPNLFNSRMVLLLLFISFRLLVLFYDLPFLDAKVEPTRYEVFTMDHVRVSQIGIVRTGDFWLYYMFARFSDIGKLPYRDYWYEFPPVAPAISLGVYSLIQNRDVTFKSFVPYAVVLSMVLAMFDTGSLLLMRRIGTRLHGAAVGVALSWIFALNIVFFVHSYRTFEPVVVFAILLSVERFTAGRNISGALAVAFGVLSKITPLIILAAVWRLRDTATALKVTVVVGAITLAGLAVMILPNPAFGVASLQAQFNKASYETVWALIDGNWRPGNFPLERDTVETAYGVYGNPAVIPWWARGIIFGGLGLLVFLQTRRRDAYGFLAFVTITHIIFYLWSQGWSPQWLSVILPLILLCFPTQRTVLFTVMLAVLSALEFPILYIQRSPSPTDEQLLSWNIAFSAVIIARTLIFVGYAYLLYQELRKPSSVSNTKAAYGSAA